MLTQTEKRTLTTNSTAEIRAAKIHATPQMFKILYDQLYTKKELAIVRELISNAWDAHVDSGNTAKPMSIHLPTMLEPFFRIKDYGTGLSPENVLSLYMDYGNSNKTHTNEMIGGFGVGSKSPFCYTDQFAVESRFNGTVYHFTAFLQEDGAPGCMQLHSEPTTEANGLTIHVPVPEKHSAMDAFTFAYKQVARHLATEPECNIKGLLESYDVESLLEHPKTPGVNALYRYKGGSRAQYISSTVPHLVVMGVVSYEFAPQDLDEGLSKTASQLFRSMQVVIHADIGSLEITASRERLSMTESTKKALRVMLNSLAEELVQDYTRRVSVAPTWFEWSKMRALLPVTTPIDGRFDHVAPQPGDPNLCVVRGLYAESPETSTVRKDPALQDGIRIRNGLGSLTYNQLQHIQTIFVRPKMVWPYKAFVADYAKHQDPSWRSLIVTGSVKRIEQRCKQVGFNVKVVELPKVSINRKAQHVRGVTKYKAITIKWNAKAEMWVNSSVSLSVTQFDATYNVQNDPNHLLFIGMHHPRALDICNALNFGLLRASKNCCIILYRVESHHSKVKRDIIKKFANATSAENLHEVLPIDTPTLNYCLSLREAQEWTPNRQTVSAPWDIVCRRHEQLFRVLNAADPVFREMQEIMRAFRGVADAPTPIYIDGALRDLPKLVLKPDTYFSKSMARSWTRFRRLRDKAVTKFPPVQLLLDRALHQTYNSVSLVLPAQQDSLFEIIGQFIDLQEKRKCKRARNSS